MISCALNPALFQDTVPKDMEGHSKWTEQRRGKATSCDTLGTVEELSDWVSCLYGFWLCFLIIYKQLNCLNPSGKYKNVLYKRIPSTFDDGSVFSCLC